MPEPPGFPDWFPALASDCRRQCSADASPGAIVYPFDELVLKIIGFLF